MYFNIDMEKDQEKKYHELLELIHSMKKVMVALSGGVDSSLLAAVAVKSGAIVESVTITNGLTTKDDQGYARQIALSLGINHHVIELDIFHNRNVIANTVERCYYCKKSLFAEIFDFAKTRGINTVIEGTHSDDNLFLRPGIKALKELDVKSPFVDVGFGKENIRFFAQELQLSCFSRPPSPCLATRIAYNEEITKNKIQMIRLAEEWLHLQGVEAVRVRLHGVIARIEIPLSDIDKFYDSEFNIKVVAYMKQVGFKYISLDLEGYREGSMLEEVE
jgi:pyridinium-3,5-biscarboxylic acid mononucleotide sulfurtransferase